MLTFIRNGFRIHGLVHRHPQFDVAVVVVMRLFVVSADHRVLRCPMSSGKVIGVEGN